MSNKLLEIKNLHVNVEDKEILKGIDLTINKGEIHVIMGPNGSGKTTTANAILSNPLYNKVEGNINFESEDITNLKTDFSNNIQEFGNEVLDSIPDEEFSDVNGYVLRNTFKNYLNLSKFNLNIRISHLNNTTVDEIPQEVKTSALPLPETDLPQPTQTTLLSKL